MSKYDKMIEENQRKSKEKIELALQAIQDMLANKERISVPKLMKKTGLSRGFFYKNPIVRSEIDRALEQQAGMIDPRRTIIDQAMEREMELLQQQIRRPGEIPRNPGERQDGGPPYRGGIRPQCR